MGKAKGWRKKPDCEHKTMDIIQLSPIGKSRCRKCGVIAESDVDLSKIKISYGTGEGMGSG